MYPECRGAVIERMHTLLSPPPPKFTVACPLDLNSPSSPFPQAQVSRGITKFLPYFSNKHISFDLFNLYLEGETFWLYPGDVSNFSLRAGLILGQELHKARTLELGSQQVNENVPISEYLVPN